MAKICLPKTLPLLFRCSLFLISTHCLQFLLLVQALYCTYQEDQLIVIWGKSSPVYSPHCQLAVTSVLSFAASSGRGLMCTRCSTNIFGIRGSLNCIRSKQMAPSSLLEKTNQSNQSSSFFILCFDNLLFITFWMPPHSQLSIGCSKDFPRPWLFALECCLHLASWAFRSFQKWTHDPGYSLAALVLIAYHPVCLLLFCVWVFSFPFFPVLSLNKVHSPLCRESQIKVEILKPKPHRWVLRVIASQYIILVTYSQLIKDYVNVPFPFFPQPPCLPCLTTPCYYFCKLQWMSCHPLWNDWDCH